MKPHYREIWVIDFEFRGPENGKLEILCLVAKEVNNGTVLRLWHNELETLDSAPFGINADTLIIAFYSSAEIRCFLNLGWPIPECLLDLYVELKLFNNGLASPHGSGLLGRALQYGITGVDKSTKEDTRDLILAKGLDVTKAEKQAILDYCQSDVNITADLFTVYLRQAPQLFTQNIQHYWQQTLFRSNYMKAVAIIEQHGIPLNQHQLEQITTHRAKIQEKLIKKLDSHHLYDGITFKRDRFIKYIKDNDMVWPYQHGIPKLDAKTFKKLARQYPSIKPLATLRETLSKLKDHQLKVSNDGRQRILLSPFASCTGRNQPSNSRYIFGAPKWMRHLIQPKQNTTLIYVDYSQQEFGIAAALSGDQVMQEAYTSGDPYLEFAKQVELVPSNATKESHPNAREKCKACVLAVHYGMAERGLADRLQTGIAEARHLLNLHRQAYRQFWKWSEATVSTALARGYIDTVCGWRLHLSPDTRQVNKRMLQNFPMQANGADMLRIAIINLVQDKIKVCAPVHDALLVEAPNLTVEETLRKTTAQLALASEILLDGFILHSSAYRVDYPDSFTNEADSKTWKIVLGALDEA